MRLAKRRAAFDAYLGTEMNVRLRIALTQPAARLAEAMGRLEDVLA